MIIRYQKIKFDLNETHDPLTPKILCFDRNHHQPRLRKSNRVFWSQQWQIRFTEETLSVVKNSQQRNPNQT